MFDKKLIKISILIPCFNENNTINMIIDRVIKSLEVYNFTNYEIIIVDDFSNDGTREKLKKLSTQDNIKIFYHSKNLGKGAAIKTAIAHIVGDITIIQDADLEYDPFDYNKLLLPFFETDSDFSLDFEPLHFSHKDKREELIQAKEKLEDSLPLLRKNLVTFKKEFHEEIDEICHS